MSTQLGRKKEAIDTQWGEVTPSEHATQQALLAAEAAMVAPRLALAAALGEVAEAKACFEKAEREVAEGSVLLIESQQRRLQWHIDQPVPAHRRGEAAAAARIRAAGRRLKYAELQAELSSLELATIRGDIDDTEFKRHDLEQEQIEVLAMIAQQRYATHLVRGRGRGVPHGARTKD